MTLGFPLLPRRHHTATSLLDQRAPASLAMSWEDQKSSLMAMLESISTDGSKFVPKEIQAEKETRQRVQSDDVM